MRWERFARWAVALIIVTVWLGLVIYDARSDTYTVPREFTAVAMVATAFILGVETVVAVIHAWRRNGNGGRPGGADP